MRRGSFERAGGRFWAAAQPQKLGDLGQGELQRLAQVHRAVELPGDRVEHRELVVEPPQILLSMVVRGLGHRFSRLLLRESLPASKEWKRREAAIPSIQQE
jgi:hypothetical protein